MINISYHDPRPIYEQVKEGFIQLIISGVMPAGTKMPSVRELATSLTINPNTIQRAYRELESEGYTVSVPGRGSFVTDAVQASAERRRELEDKLRAAARELRLLGMTAEEIKKLVEEVEE